MLKIESLSVSIGRTDILKDINLEIKPHTVTVIIGQNAAGKSSLLSCLTGERKHTGTISFSGKNLAMLSSRERASLVSLLPQHLPKAEITVEELVKLGRTPHLDFAGHFTSEDKNQVENAINETGISHLKEKRISEISGGERQKAYLAMTLAQNTRLIALDEPTTYMDARHEREFSELLVSLAKKKKKTILAVMHDLTRAVEIADRIIIIENGEALIHDSTEKVKKSGLIEKIFGVGRYDIGEMTIYR